VAEHIVAEGPGLQIAFAHMGQLAEVGIDSGPGVAAYKHIIAISEK